jgi:hypothetical protein
MRATRIVVLVALAVLLQVLAAAAARQARPLDLVVYGGTAGGVITAVAAAREGLNVALLEPRDHLGGMVSGGLGWTDFGRKEVIGGYSLEYFTRVGWRYGEPIAWHFEPHVAEAVFKELVDEAGVKVFYRHRLRERNGVLKDKGRVIEIAMENGASFRAKVFADASYEGDLMAQARVSYTWGREAMSRYNESLAGVREHTPKHQFVVKVSPYNAEGRASRLLPEVQPGPKGMPGEADKKVQAYNFRLCLTAVAENRVPFAKPRGYDPWRYELLARMLQAMDAAKRETGARPWSVSDVMKPDPIPHGKTDTNNNGAFSTDYVGGSWNYPEADYKTREQIWQSHTSYIQGFFYFLANDPRVPHSLQAEMQTYGLCRDEFIDTDHWPRQLYIREARRMVGEYVMTQKDIQTELTKDDVIGMGSYNSDSHNVQRVATPDGSVENEGDMQVPVTPYQIPYRVMLPKLNEATNLLVPVALSASHVAYSTLRMEPQYMIIGHAAGIAAKMAIDAAVAVQSIDTKALTARLRSQGAVMEWKAEHNFRMN